MKDKGKKKTEGNEDPNRGTRCRNKVWMCALETGGSTKNWSKKEKGN